MKGDSEIKLTNIKAAGAGSFGKVYTGDHQGKRYAVKRRYIVDSKSIPPGCVHVNEVDIMRRLNHPNIEHAIVIQRKNPLCDNFRQDSYNPTGTNVGATFRADLVYVITDAADGDLNDLVITETGKVETKEHIDTIRSIMWQILSGVAYLHAQKVIHRDLKPANILFTNTKERDVKKITICDFDMCLPDIPGFISYKAMTPEYTPPEILTQGEDVVYTSKVDIWSVGCTLYYLIHGEDMIRRGDRRGFDLDNYIIAAQAAYLPGGNELVQAISSDISDVRISLDTEDAAMTDLLRKMLHCDPEQRPSAIECMQHPFFQSFPIPVFPEVTDFTIEKHHITESMAAVFDPYMEEKDPSCHLSESRMYGFFLGLDILMRVCTNKYRGDHRNLAICCFNIGMKFYGKEQALYIPIDPEDAKRIEYSIIADKLDGKIYRDNIYNHIQGFHREIYKYLMAPQIFPCKFSDLLTAIKKNLGYP